MEKLLKTPFFWFAAFSLLAVAAESGIRLLPSHRDRPEESPRVCIDCDPVVGMLDRRERSSLALGNQPAPLADAADDEILIADFEGDTYGTWQVTGTAFGPGPARGTLPGQMPVSGFQGKGLVNSFFEGDGTTGTLTSPEFQIQRPFLNFLLGGGEHPGETCINLLLDGKIVRTASGPNDRPGGSEHLDWQTWNVADLAGKTVQIQIVDRHTGGWGHINVDQITQSTQRRQLEPVRREIVASKKYLHLPVKTGAPGRRMRLLVDDVVAREFEIELAESEPQFFVPCDIEPFRGQTVVVEVQKLPAGSQALDGIVASDDYPDSAHLYQEALRPQFHFTSRRGWLNDPNGLVFLDGEYHLFYQHNPYGWNWGNMHWGHAVSRDLVRWRELPEALYPREFGDWAFSGSAVVDHQNTSGLGTAQAPALVATFTSTGRGECVVFSTDRGRSWKEFEGNPVVKHAGRDPRLLWHQPTRRWVMAVYDETEGKQWIAFYTSPNLTSWEFSSRIEGYFECPDLFELPVANSLESRWVLYAADGRYVLGSFDGREFVPETPKLQLWHGNFYAAQTFSNMPDGRRVQIGWGNGVTFPEMPFNQQMTVACELTLRQTDEGLRMHAWPVREVATLATTRRLVAAYKTLEGTPPGLGVENDLLDVTATFQRDDAERVGIEVLGVSIEYDVAAHELRCRDKKVPLLLRDEQLQLRILADRGSLEVFVDGGRVALVSGGTYRPQDRQIRVFASGGTAVAELTVDMLKSAWSDD